MQEAKQRDNLLNVIFALTVRNNDSKRHCVHLDFVKEVVDKINMFSGNASYVREYDIPSLEPSNIKKNSHVDFVSDDKDIGYHMDYEESQKILNRNEDLVRLIVNFDCITEFNKEVEKISDGRMVYDFNSPDNFYELIYYNDGMDYRENILLTDGDVDVITQNDFYKLVKVNNATYSILAAYDENGLTNSIVRNEIVHPVVFNLLKEIVKDFWNARVEDYTISEAPYVYRKKLN